MVEQSKRLRKKDCGCVGLSNSAVDGFMVCGRCWAEAIDGWKFVVFLVFRFIKDSQIN